ncbi:hypothetical protein [Leadbetterella byssophila]|uniref:hypothetical protein n=1 Tax=Leadbetterella byssophila TaxID=316068 RepID=UPI0039A1C647
MDRQRAYLGIEIEEMEDGRVRVSQKELKTARILNQKELVSIGKQHFPGKKIVPSVFSLNTDPITPEWITEKMQHYNIKPKDLIKQLGIERSVVKKIMRGEISLSKQTKAAFYFYFRNFELMEDFEDFMNVAE